MLGDNLEENTNKGTFKQGGMEIPLSLQKTEKTVPGNPELVSSEADLNNLSNFEKGNYKYSVEDYFANPKGISFRFSPDGKYLSYRERDAKGKQHVYVKNIQTGKAKRVIQENEELIRGYGWLNSERLFLLFPSLELLYSVFFSFVTK